MMTVCFHVWSVASPSSSKSFICEQGDFGWGGGGGSRCLYNDSCEDVYTVTSAFVWGRERWMG